MDKHNSRSVKYRPNFSAAQLRKLSSLCKHDTERDNDTDSILAVIIPLLAKIDSGISKGAYENKGRTRSNDINSISNDGYDYSRNEPMSMDDILEDKLMNSNPDKVHFDSLRAGTLTEETEDYGSLLFLAIMYGDKHGLLNAREASIAKEWEMITPNYDEKLRGTAESSNEVSTI